MKEVLMFDTCSLPAYTRQPRLRYMSMPITGGPAPHPVPTPPPGHTPPPAPAGPKNFVDTDTGKEWDFPADTKVKDMTADQAKAYWEHKAKKHEKNRKPDDYDQIVADAQAFRSGAKPPEGEPGQPDPKALDAARVEGQAAGLLATIPTTLRYAIRATNPDIDDEDLDEIIDDLDLKKFVRTDGQLDADRIQKLSAKHAVKAGDAANGQPGDPLANALGHHQQQPGSGTPTGAGSVASLREQAREQLQPKKS